MPQRQGKHLELYFIVTKQNTQIHLAVKSCETLVSDIIRMKSSRWVISQREYFEQFEEHWWWRAVAAFGQSQFKIFHNCITETWI